LLIGTKNIMAYKKIAIIGLGYVGLPLAIEFGKFFDTIGFDINKSRIEELTKGIDSTMEISSKDFLKSKNLAFTSVINDIKKSNIFIITVPTPVNQNFEPDLEPLKKATLLVANLLKKDDIVIYESTVYPGATEEICVPILEENSNLIFNHDFFCGYSPERINPGDKEHRITNIKKVTSGSNPKTADEVDLLYKQIIIAGTHKVKSIKVAEAAKIIENTQRDVNIALINEFAIIFNKLGIDTEEVLEAAGTKWNFLPFRPGIVGGHCIGVDPYYLTFKALQIGYHPTMILSGRNLNNYMGSYIVDQVSSLMVNKGIDILSANVLIMGLAFKENCPDIRNTGVISLINDFKKLNCNIDIFDPWVDKNTSHKDYGISLIDEVKNNFYDAIILAVAHDQFKELSIKDIQAFGKENYVLYDIKYIFKKDEVDGRL
jgi:UDP-N-acetyl-D-glucosamine/UDP-N-acetyl-D-galactosamine dehydrogenase